MVKSMISEDLWEKQNKNHAKRLQEAKKRPLMQL